MKKINKFLQKVFGNRSINLDILAHYLTKCAKSHTYIETLGKHSDSLHNWIKSSYEIDFIRAFELQVRLAIKKLRIINPKLAIDITYEPFYGDTRNLHIFNTSKDKKNNGEFQFITCCVINRNKQIPLMALPVRYGEQIKLTIDLLRYCLSMFKHIKCCLFDRGFYSAELIDFLEANKIKYLILVPKFKGKLSKFVDDTIKLGKYKHQLYYFKKKTKWKPKTQITVCKNICEFDWLFATNIQFDQATNYVFLYKRRWQIETNYRVEDEAKIKSKSCNYMIRYFYFLISQLLHLLWIIHKKHNYYVQFKKYLDIIEYKLLYNFLKIEGI